MDFLNLKKQSPIPTLQFDTDSFQEPEINLAARIANKILKTKLAKSVLEMFSLDPKNWLENISKTKIIYKPQPPDKKQYILGWIDGSSKLNTIFINEIFQKRLQILRSNESANVKEIEIITFFLSVIIIHELGHLLFRWAGLDSSPPKFKDSGSFLERKLFDGSVHILSRPKSEWTPNSEHYGKILA